MATKRFSQLKNLTLEELNTKIHETYKALFQTRMKKGTPEYKSSDPALIWKLRKNLASMKMLVTQKNLKQE